jgi:tetratricopeptide (TPR) repeat protein
MKDKTNWWGQVRFLRAPFVLFWRRPGRVLAVLALFALLGLLIGLAGLLLWVWHHLGAARLAVQRGHNMVALRHLEVCPFLEDDLEVLLLRARIARRFGAWSEAELLLDRARQLHGDDEALVLERLLFRASQGDLEATRPILERIIARDDATAALAREALVTGLLYRFHLPQARKQIDAWLEHEPDSTMALLAKGKLHDRRLQSSDSLETYRRLLELDPEHDEARLRLSSNLVQLRQGEEALPHLEYLRRRLPDNLEVLVQLGQALDLVERGDEARAIFDECLRRNPDHATALAERGRMALRDGDGKLAEESLARAVRIDPGDLSARHQYQLALNHNGKKAEAAAQEEEARRLKADLERIHHLLNQRLQQAPNDAAALHEVAMITLRAGRPQEALRWLLNALEADPNHGPTHRVLAWYYRETGNPILATRHRAIAQRLGALEKTKSEK